jgi:hypothetical protein
MTFWTGAKLADHLKRSRWSVVLLAPLALGFTYYWGLVGNLVGFAAFLGVLPAMDRSAASPSLRGLINTCALLMLTFFAHESVFMTATAFLAMLALAYPLDARKTTLRFVPVLFATLVAFLHQVWASRFYTGAIIDVPTGFTPLWEKIKVSPNVLFGSHDFAAQLMLTGLSLLAMTLLLIARLRSNDEALAPSPTSGTHTDHPLARAAGFVLRYRFELTSFAFFIAYFVMPFNWRGATLLYERFMGPAWALLVICAGPRVATPRLAKITGAVVPVAVLLVSWPQFADANATFENLDAVIDAIPKNSAVALAVLDRPIFRTRIYSASVGPARTIAARGGRVGLSLLISPISPVQIDPAYRWDEFDRRTLLSGSRSLKPSYDLQRFGWVIAQSREVAIRDILVDAFKPDAELVIAKGEWLLFRSTHPQLPMASPETPPPRSAETIGDRVTYLLRKRYQNQQPMPEPSTSDATP